MKKADDSRMMMTKGLFTFSRDRVQELGDKPAESTPS
jgi:hypothetical protein